MLQFKKISVNLALAMSLTAFAGVNYAQAENISLPLPADDSDIQAVMDSVKANVDVNGVVMKDIMRQTRDRMKEEQAQRLPLMPQFRNTIGQVVSARVQVETRTKTMNAQMEAMQDPVNPEAVPTAIAPTFD
ncbi:hypothetical protein KKHLCK_09655 [Candidatus Electrothrix laxa]